MGGSALHAGEEVLHDRGAAGHGAEHGLFGEQGGGLEEAGIEPVGCGKRLAFVSFLRRSGDGSEMHGILSNLLPWLSAEGREG